MYFICRSRMKYRCLDFIVSTSYNDVDVENTCSISDVRTISFSSMFSTKNRWIIDIGTMCVCRLGIFVYFTLFRLNPIRNLPFLGNPTDWSDSCTARGEAICILLLSAGAEIRASNNNFYLFLYILSLIKKRYSFLFLLARSILRFISTCYRTPLDISNASALNLSE